MSVAATGRILTAPRIESCDVRLQPAGRTVYARRGALRFNTVVRDRRMRGRIQQNIAMSTSFTPDPAIAALLAPSGRLRASINLGNPILANTDPATGRARGVSVDLAHALAERLGVPLETIEFPAATKSVDAVPSGAAAV